MDSFKVIIVEDVPLELKGTEGILKNDVPEAEVIGTAGNEAEYWRLMKQQQPDLVLLDLGLHDCRCGNMPTYQGGIWQCKSLDFYRRDTKREVMGGCT